jgi:hypothetical protein
LTKKKRERRKKLNMWCSSVLFFSATFDMITWLAWKAIFAPWWVIDYRNG